MRLPTLPPMPRCQKLPKRKLLMRLRKQLQCMYLLLLQQMQLRHQLLRLLMVQRL
jgi:hypothetical protein